MRTNIVLDEKMLREAFAVSAARTKKDLIHEALRVLVSIRKRKDLTELAGKIDFTENYNHKALSNCRNNVCSEPRKHNGQLCKPIMSLPESSSNAKNVPWF